MSPVLAWVPYGIIAAILVVTRIPQIGIKGILNVTTAPWTISIPQIFGIEVGFAWKWAWNPGVLPFILVAFLIILKLGMIGGGMVDLTVAQGAYLFAAGIPIGVVGIISGIQQGKAAAAGLQLTAKRPDQMTKGVIYAAMVETYAILALLVSILIWLGTSV